MPAPTKTFRYKDEPSTLPQRYSVRKRVTFAPTPTPSRPVAPPARQQKTAAPKEAQPRPAQPSEAVAKTQLEALRRTAQQTLQQSQARLQTLAAQLQLQAAMAVQQAAAASAPTKGTQFGQVDLASFQKPLPSWYRPELVKWHGVVLQADAMRALQKASQMVGVPILGGGYRSHAAQVSLYARKPGLAAPPGYSYHEVGLAIDVDVERLKALGLWERARRALLAVGFRQFDPQKEPWHFSYIIVG